MSLIARFPLPASLGGPTPPSLSNWQWQFNGVTMGPGTSFGIMKVTGMNLASIRSGDVDLPRDHGQLIGLDVYGPRDVMLDLWMTGSGGLLSNQLALSKAMQLYGGGATELPLWFQAPGQGVNVVPDPSFEYDTVGNAPAAGVTVATSSAQLISGATATVQTSGGAVSGTKALKVVTDGLNSNEGWQVSLGILPAGTYSVSAYMKGNAGGESLALIATNDSGVGAVFAPLTATTSFQRVTLTFTANGTTTAWLVARGPGTATAVTYFVDAAMVTAGATLQTYFDGDFPGYYWTGTPGNSTSAPLLLCAMSKVRKRDMAWDAEYAAGGRGEPSVAFHSTDPRLYLPGTSQTIALTSSGGGGLGPFPVGPFPLTFGQSSGNTTTITNQGNCETRPIVIFNGPCTNPRITNLTTSGTLTFQNPNQTSYTVLSGDQLVVDLGQPHRILYYQGGVLSGSTPVPEPNWIVQGSSWWDLPAGPNSIQYGTQDTTTVGIGSAQVVWASAYQL